MRQPAVIVSFFLLLSISWCATGLSAPDERIEKPIGFHVKLDLDRDVYSKTQYQRPPQFALWIENQASGEIRTLYVTQKLGRGSWNGKSTVPVTLPYWVSRYNQQTGTTGDPTSEQPLADAITQPTPTDQFQLSFLVNRAQQWDCYVEINVSGDFNERFPNETDDGTKDTYGNGQPSLVYRASLPQGPESRAEFQLVGRTSQHSTSPELFEDLTGITTARQLLARAQVEGSPERLENRPARLEWLQDAGFGMFIHWSHDSQIGSVISHSMAGASDEYIQWFVDELPKTFVPKDWDPDAIARLAKIAGMQYVVLTAKHHSGFCLWDSQTTDFKITNTPYATDILPGYVAALRRQGIQVGLYYSPEDFNWLHQHGHPVCRRGEHFVDPDEDPEYREFVRRQVTELFSQYGPIDMLFIDGEGEEITKHVCWSLQPNCLITRGAIETPEQFVPGRPPEGPWEACLTMGTQWQYKPTNDEYKSGTRMIEILIETRAKGGSLLLNVGPRPSGQLPIEQESRLREIALWHAVNGQSIHNTRPWIIPREDNIWFTRQKDGDTVYAFLTGIPEWPRGSRKEFLLKSIQATDQTRISVLGHAGLLSEYAPSVDAEPRFEQTGDGLKISVCRAQRLYNNHKWHNPVVVKLDHVQPAMATPPYAETGKATIQNDGGVTLEGELIELAGAAQVEIGFELQEFLGFEKAMYNTQWTATAMRQMDNPGPFRLRVRGLKPNTNYQYRTIVKHPQLTVRGDHVRFTTK
jgi:alpha-L-fucosidase